MKNGGTDRKKKKSRYFEMFRKFGSIGAAVMLNLIYPFVLDVGFFRTTLTMTSTPLEESKSANRFPPGSVTFFC